MPYEREIERVNVKDVLDIYSKKIDVPLLSRLYDVERDGLENYENKKLRIIISEKAEGSIPHRSEKEITYGKLLEMIPDENIMFFKLVR